MRSVCLINPPQTHLFNPLSYPPLGLLYIAGALESQGFDVYIHNQPQRTLEQQKNEIPEADIYGITTTTATLAEVVNLVKYLKETFSGAVVVVGGIHATVKPEETLKMTGADHVFVGEGEELFPAFCKNPADYDPIIEARRIYNLDSLPFPARHLLPVEVIQDKSGIHLSGAFTDNDYATTIITSRGCPFRCAFCCKTKITEGVRYRSPDSIFSELIHLRDKYNIHQFRIIDDAFTVDRYRCEDLMKLTAGQELYFTTILRADSIVSRDMLQVLYDGGVRVVSIGVESASQRILDLINKRERIEEIKQVIQWCHDVGVKIKVFIIFGLPGETLETVEETKAFFREIKPDAYTLSSFIPLPGSDIYENPAKYGIKPKWESGKYDDYFFYYEPGEGQGFHYEMPEELKKKRGELISYLRSGCWR